LEIATGQETLTVVGGCRLITDFGDGKRNRLMYTSYFKLGNRYFKDKVAKKCHTEIFKQCTFHKTIGSYINMYTVCAASRGFFMCHCKFHIGPYYQITKQK
jgi:hypothetical protein